MSVCLIIISLFTVAFGQLMPGNDNHAAPVASAQATATLEVMTYNIRTGNARDGLDAWPVRKSRTLKLIQKHNPDLIGLQEAVNFQLADLQTSMSSYAVVGSGRADGRAGNEFSAIMYRTSRLQLLRSDTFWLSDTPEIPGTTHWGNKNLRVCTWAHFHDLKTDKFFFHFNTHLDHISQPSRQKSVALILKRIQGIKPIDDVIITGDFNAGEQNPIIESILGAGYRDSFRVLHPDETNVGTTTAFGKIRQPRKIDYIFIDDNWKVKAADIPDDKYDGRWPSDHLPVTATLLQK